jgi:transposase
MPASKKNRRGKELTSNQKHQIIGLHRGGHSIRKISSLLGFPKSTVNDTVQKYKKIGSAENAKRSGRPPKLDDRDIRHLAQIMRSNHRSTASRIAQIYFEVTEIRISDRTLRKYAHRLRYYSRMTAPKPFVTELQRTYRLRWCKNLLDWGSTEWGRVIWSDESRFEIFQNDGPSRVWRLPGQRFIGKNLRPTVKHGGGGIMVWGCFSLEGGLGPLVRIEGTLNRFGYIDLLTHHFLPYLNAQFYSKMYFFQDDNAPVHTARAVMRWFKKEDILELPNWPSQSPDLNPIENLWGELERRVKRRNYQPTNADDLWRVVKEEWDNIPVEVYANLIYSMPRRIKSCIAAKGYPTKY